MSSESSSVTSAPVRLTGRVKWFNNKTGFGFISVVGGNDDYKDASEIFVHHSAIKVSQEQYRYLVEGEYVEFSVVTTESGVHKFQAGDVRGVKGGMLFCETRHEHRSTNVKRGADSHTESREDNQNRQGSVSRGRGGRSLPSGRGGSYNGRMVRGGRVSGSSEWMLIRRDRNERGDGYNSRQRQDRSSGFGDKSQSQTESQQSVVQPEQTTSVSTPSSDSVKTPRAPSTRKPRQTKPTA
jgi:CspA family cold shock protein